MMNFFKFLWRINIKTIFFNFKYLPIHQAIFFPFWISKKVSLLCVKGNISIEAPVKTGMIQIGYGKVGIFDKKYSRTIWEVSGTVIFKGCALIGHGSKISVANSACLKFGDNFNLTAESSIVTQKMITFGDDCMISWDCLIMDTDFHNIMDLSGKIINNPKPIIIGCKVWIGCRSLILKGSIIADRSIIGANSLVNKELLCSGMYAGNPIRLIRHDVYWEL